MSRNSVRNQDRQLQDNMRIVVAQEAARIIHNQGIDDFRTAKMKAAENLGLRNHRALPTNQEIEQALAEHSRIFGGERHESLVDSLRTVALAVMYDLQLFKPCLVGPVLSGNVTEHSAINLHLFSDTAETVGMELHQRGIRHSSMLRKHRLQRDRFQQFPGYRFLADNFEVEATVFPERGKAHPPLSPVDGKPMRRAKLQDVERLATDISY